MMFFICTKFHENIFNGIKEMEPTRFSCEKFQRGIIPQKFWWSNSSLFSAHRLVKLNICTKFHEIILNGIRVIKRTRFSY